jgi:hypothetical protein
VFAQGVNLVRECVWSTDIIRGMCSKSFGFTYMCAKFSKFSKYFVRIFLSPSGSLATSTKLLKCVFLKTKLVSSVCDKRLVIVQVVSAVSRMYKLRMLNKDLGMQEPRFMCFF